MRIDWFKLRDKEQAEREFSQLHGPRQYRIITLPENEWTVCPHCNGTGSYLEPGDLHRSEGWVPCPKMVTTKTVEIPRRVRVKALSRVVP